MEGCTDDSQLSCAFYHDLLQPSATLCKSLQSDEICVVTALEAILKTSKAMDKVKATAFEDLPSVKTVLSRIDSTSNTYQGAELSKHEQGLSFLKSHFQEYTDLFRSVYGIV